MAVRTCDGLVPRRDGDVFILEFDYQNWSYNWIVTEQNACDNPWDILSHIVVYYSNSKSHLLESTTIVCLLFEYLRVTFQPPILQILLHLDAVRQG